tara:strand:- start:541 stop:1125 length:585 start_codon:yes stop_codon:yes gene_type:complete
MNLDVIEEMLRRSALKRPVEIRSMRHFIQPAVPQRGTHLSDLPCAIVSMIFSINNFIAPVNMYSTPTSKKQGIEAFAYVGDLAALRLVNVSMSRRFKNGLCTHTVQRAIHLKPKSPVKMAFAASIVSFVIMMQAMRCQTEQGTLAFAFLKAFRIQEILDVANAEKKTKIKEMVNNVNEYSNGVPTWEPSQRLLC